MEVSLPMNIIAPNNESVKGLNPGGDPALRGCGLGGGGGAVTPSFSPISHGPQVGVGLPEKSPESPGRSAPRDCGTERPDCGTERPDCGTERPDCGTERPDCGTERPDCGLNTPLPWYEEAVLCSTSLRSGECFLCRSRENPEEHHIDWNHANDSVRNRVLLCERCHVVLHRGGYVSLAEMLQIRNTVSRTSSRRPL